MGLEPAMMTWHVTKAPSSDFCTMGYHITPYEDQLQPHDEEVCEDIVFCMAQDSNEYDSGNVAGSIDKMLTLYHGMNEPASTMFYTKKLWIPRDFDESDMYEDLGYNYSRSTETARWLHDPDPQMNMFIEAHGAKADEKKALKRNTRMFTINNENYISACMNEEMGLYDYDYLPYDRDEVLGSQFWHNEQEPERVLLRV